MEAIMLIKLTTEQYLAAGQAIMADPRCDDTVKDVVRRGTNGEADSNGMRSYYTTADNTWYDQIMRRFGTRANNARSNERELIETLRDITVLAAHLEGRAGLTTGGWDRDPIARSRKILQQYVHHPEFCTRPEQCALKGRCPRDIVCND